MELNYSITVFDMFSSNIQNIIFCKFQNSELNLENIGRLRHIHSCHRNVRKMNGK